MKILLLKKKTSSARQRESLRALEQRDLLPPQHLQAIERADMEHANTLEQVREILAASNCQVTEVHQTDPWPQGKFDLIVTLGGDGTVLNASYFLQNNATTIAGIRSSPHSVGKLCAFDYSQLEHFATCLQAGGEMRRVELQRLRAEITCNRTGKKRLSKAVLNDFLYTNDNPAAMTHYVIKYAQRWESHKSSGVWIATAAGSSAALQAAGGRSTDVASGTFQFQVRELYQASGNYIDGCEFDLQDSQLTICSLCERALLALDGHHHALPLQYGDTIAFKAAPPVTIAWTH